MGGRCLASGFGVDDLVDEEKYVFDMTVIRSCSCLVFDFHRFQDAFMYGVRHLVCPFSTHLIVGVVLMYLRQFWAPGNFELVVLAQASPRSIQILESW